MTNTTQTAALAAAAASESSTQAAANAAAIAMASLTPQTQLSVDKSLANTPVNVLMKNIATYQYNPAGIQSAVLLILEGIRNGELQIVDPTNPFVFCLEAASVMTAAAMMKNETNTRKQYPFVAQTIDDLYLHMSDIDYINRFAVPSSTVFSILIPLNEAISKMVLDPATGVKKLVIPRNSVFTIADTNFSIQYPIEIKQLSHGGIQVSYDTSITSPLQNLSSNIIQHEIRQDINDEYIYFEFNVMQFDIISQTGSLNAATEFSIDIPFVDQYYYTRVYVEDANGKWQEIRTTHTDQVYDINVPTAVLKVNDQSLNLKIPQIYTATGVLNRGIRIDVYQTKGPLNLILYEYPFSAFSARWLAIDPNDQTEFTAPLETINTIIPFSNKVVTGGKNSTSFADLRNQVITNGLGTPSLPITNVQLTNAFMYNGYTIVRNVDNITNRVFLAIKGMPAPNDTSLITAANSTIATISLTVSDLIALSTVINNLSTNNSITITPDTLYKNVNGVISPIPDSELNTLLNLSNDLLAVKVSSNKYLYTPFHYVVDLTGAELAMRPYYLDAPEIITKLFVDQNQTTMLQVNTGVFNIYRTATGYSITIVTISGPGYKALLDSQCFVQLSFIPKGEKVPAFINGKFEGTTADGERIYTFDLSTNFNVDSDGYIQLTKFQMFANQPRLAAANLLTEFNIVYGTTAPMGSQWVAGAIDQSLGNFLLQSNPIAITSEVLRVLFGHSLDRLWAKSRSIASTIKYQKYATDVPAIYSKDVYQSDANGSYITWDAANNPILTKLHSAGDPVLDNQGNQVYSHRVGDTVTDIYGNPIISNARDVLRQLDIMLIDGVYWFANDQAANNYRTVISTSLLEWLTNDLVNLESQVLEQTNIYFYPNTTVGIIQAVVDDGAIVAIEANQSFVVDLSVPQVVYNNNALKAQLETSTIATIAAQLNNKTVSIDSITTALRSVYGTDVTSFKISGLGGSKNYSVITINDNSKRCSIKKVLVAMPDNTVVVKEDVSINFINYN